jgi:hypothetical protein
VRHQTAQNWLWRREETPLSAKLSGAQTAADLTHQAAILVDDLANPHRLPFLERLTALLDDL